MECRPGCAACCIAPSISQPIPNMPNGKKAGEPCANLDTNTFRCRIWQSEIYPELCARFKAEQSVCGESREQALQVLEFLEHATS